MVTEFVLFWHQKKAVLLNQNENTNQRLIKLETYPMSSKLMHKWFLKEKQLILEKCKHLSRQVPHPTRASPEPNLNRLHPSALLRSNTGYYYSISTFQSFHFQEWPNNEFLLTISIHSQAESWWKKNVNKGIVLH